MSDEQNDTFADRTCVHACILYVYCVSSLVEECLAHEDNVNSLRNQLEQSMTDLEMKNKVMYMYTRTCRWNSGINMYYV